MDAIAERHARPGHGNRAAGDTYGRPGDCHARAAVAHVYRTAADCCPLGGAIDHAAVRRASLGG